VNGLPDIWRLRPNAPASGQELCELSALPEHGAKEFVFGRGASAFSMFVVRALDGIRAYLNVCPHFSLPLNYRKDEFLTPEGDRIICTQHLAIFRIADGYCEEGACRGLSLDSIPVTVVNGIVKVA
jgi:nitrite reductase/ring-hydroxylating ferredoxin subunit